MRKHGGKMYEASEKLIKAEVNYQVKQYQDTYG